MILATFQILAEMNKVAETKVDQIFLILAAETLAEKVEMNKVVTRVVFQTSAVVKVKMLVAMNRPMKMLPMHKKMPSRRRLSLRRPRLRRTRLSRRSRRTAT
jgi:hypothetical protein